MSAPFRTPGRMIGSVAMQILASTAGYTDPDAALGKWVRAGSLCTERQSYSLTDAQVAAVFGPKGAEALIAAELGERVEGGIRMLQMDGEIEWYGELSSKRRRAGQARAASAQRDERGRLLPAADRQHASTEPARAGDAGPSTASTEPARSSAPDPSPAPSLSPDRERSEISPLTPLTGGSSSRRKSKRLEITEPERASALVVLGKLSERSGIAYRGGDAHLRLIAARLRGGASEMDLRAIVAYCAESKTRGGLGWAESDMRSYLRPETLFGPQTVERYLDAARTWLAELQRRQQPADEHERRPATSSPAMPLPLRPAYVDDERDAS